MNTATSILLALALLAASAAGGAYLYSRLVPPPESVVVTTPPEVVTKVVTKIVTRNVPIGPNTCPDSTTIETVETETVTNNVITQVRRDWSLGVGFDTKRAFDRDYMPTSVELGRRTFGDLWLASSWNWRDGSLLLGVRYEF